MIAFCQNTASDDQFHILSKENRGNKCSFCNKLLCSTLMTTEPRLELDENSMAIVETQPREITHSFMISLHTLKVNVNLQRLFGHKNPNFITTPFELSRKHFNLITALVLVLYKYLKSLNSEGISIMMKMVQKFFLGYPLC